MCGKEAGKEGEEEGGREGREAGHFGRLGVLLWSAGQGRHPKGVWGDGEEKEEVKLCVMET